MSDLRRRLAHALAFAAMAVLALAASAERRVALLIGNNTYNATPLQNAVNDARDLGAALAKLGFTTIVRENTTRRDMVEALREFGQSLEGADAAVFFYAGHALQFKDRNYLVPIDSDVRSEDDIGLFAVEIQLVFDRMDRARTRQNIVILDACRDNPFAATFKVASPGLAQSTAPSGTLIAYATAPGSVAADGFGRNGMYTKHLLQHIGEANLSVETLFKRVRAGVEKETAKRQTPWDSSSLKGEFQFNPASRGTEGTATAAAPAHAIGPSADVQLQIEREFWVSVRDSNRAEELQAYLEHYPNGKFVTLARLRLQNLGTAPVREPPPRSSWLAPRLHKAAWTPAQFSTAPQSAQPPKLEDLFGHPYLADMQLSPEGTHVAGLMPVRGRQNVVVLDLATRKGSVITAMTGSDVVYVRWLSNRRLIFQTGSRVDRICGCRLGTMFGIDIDGTNDRQLNEGADAPVAGRATFRTLIFVRPFPGKPDDFIAQEISANSAGDATHGGLYRVDSRTGRKQLVTLGKPDSGENEEWVFDNAGVPRVFSVHRRAQTVVYYRPGDNAPWQKIDEFKLGAAAWRPLAIAPDGKSILANSFRGRDKAAIVQVDPVAGGAERVIASHPYVDVSDLNVDEGVAVGIAYNADRPGFAWFDEELERIQGTVDAALPFATNELSWSRNRTRVLVRSASDVAPGTYYLFDRATGKIEYFADQRPTIKRAAMSPVKPVRYRARDGLDIPAYLALPRGVAQGERQPLVVLVHDGPWSAGVEWRFSPAVQFLASRGFAVLQPNFRGTMRYGWKHFRSSFKQWGRAMQDDLVDGVEWTVAQGYADGDRVCIVGEGYGGYAALMALATAPAKFRCAASVSAITDLVEYMSSASSPVSSTDMARFSLPEMIGDPRAERAALLQASPVEQAARIRGPVFLAARLDDMLVPFEHSQRMRSALERSGSKPVWLPLKEEGHGLEDLANTRSLYEAIERFLREQLAAKT